METRECVEKAFQIRQRVSLEWESRQNPALILEQPSVETHTNQSATKHSQCVLSKCVMFHNVK